MRLQLINGKKRKEYWQQQPTERVFLIYGRSTEALIVLVLIDLNQSVKNLKIHLESTTALVKYSLPKMEQSDSLFTSGCCNYSEAVHETTVRQTLNKNMDLHSEHKEDQTPRHVCDKNKKERCHYKLFQPN